MERVSGETVDLSPPERSKAWRWQVCILLLLATAINYMDRQTLSVTSKRIIAEFQLSKEQYGDLEMWFGLAFAAGSLGFGLLADLVSVRWLYAALLLGWSAAGFTTGIMETYSGLLVCRTVLGFFEAGHWPCALKTIQRIHERKDRAMGNSLLQSGASIGAILTPIIVQGLLDAGRGWRASFLWIGAAGSFWTVAWLAAIRSKDLSAVPPRSSDARGEDPAAQNGDAAGLSMFFSSRFFALIVMVACISVSWQLLRAWLPLYLQEGRGYSEKAANRFTSAYYIATDVGVLTAGFASLRLVRRGFSVHGSRSWTFLGCALFAFLATTAASLLPHGALFLGSLLVAGFGLLGVYPSYYAFAQEISVSRQGLVNGVLGVCSWLSSSIAQKYFGRYVDATHSYDLGVRLAGMAPLASLVIFALLWNWGHRNGGHERKVS